MPDRDVRRWAAFLPVALVVFQGCASLPRMVRYSDPLTPDQHAQLGAAYEEKGLKEDARRQYASALRAEKDHVPSLLAQGNLAFEAGRLKEAEKSYRRALRAAPGLAAVQNNLAMVLLARGKLAEAEQLAREAAGTDGPWRAYFLDTLASIHIRQGRIPEARRALDEADASAPPGHDALLRQLAATRAKLPEPSL